MTTSDVIAASPNGVVVISAARLPQGRLNGQLVPFSAVELGAKAVTAALEHSSIAPTPVNAVITGQVIPAGAGQNLGATDSHRRWYQLGRPCSDH